MTIVQPAPSASPNGDAMGIGDAQLPEWLANAVRESRARGRKGLDEATGKRLLATCGIAVPPARRVNDPADLGRALAALRPPWVLKVDSPDLVHKSEAGGVRLGLVDEAAVRQAMDSMITAGRERGFQVDGFLIEETAPEGHQVVLGGMLDPSFGPMMMFGLGGVFVEVLGDVAFRLCPLSRLDALDMISDLRGAALLAGARGGVVADVPALVDAMLAVGGENGLLMRFAGSFPQIDINPIIVGPAGAVAVDARFILPDHGDHDVAAKSAARWRRASRPSSTVSFEALFAPRAVAVAGVSSASTAQGNTFIRRLREAGYDGDIYPIHPSASFLEGLPAFPGLSATPRPVDYAFVAIPAEKVPGLLEGAQGRVRFAQVMTSGFGSDGISEERLLEAARMGGVRLLGPNCMGTYSPGGRLSFLDGGIGPVGNVGVLSQSGGLSIDIVRHGRQRGLAFSGVVSLGNSSDLGPTDLIEHFLEDPGTQVIGAYLEDVRDGRRLFNTLSKARRRKPVVILRGGRSRQGQRAALSHTGSLSSPQEAWRALASQTGAVLCNSLESFVAALLAFQAFSRRAAGPPSARLVLLGNGGGASVLAADCLAEHGLTVAPLGSLCSAALAKLDIPPGASLANPIDIPANSLKRDRGALVQRVLETVGALERPGTLLVHLNLPVILGYRHLDMLGDLTRAILAARPLIASETRLAVCLRSCGDVAVEERRRAIGLRLAEADIPVFLTLNEAAGALAALHAFETFQYSRSNGIARDRTA